MNGPEMATKKRNLRAGARAARRTRRAAASDTEWKVLADRLAATALDVVRAVAPGGGVVTSYESVGAEPPTAAMNRVLTDAGYEVLVPITLDDLDLDWQRVGTDEPLGREAIGDAAVAFTPGTLVDRQGRRLGQGGGCYDRSLPRRRTGTPAIVVVFDEEVVEGPLPAADHDAVVDGYLTPGGWRLLAR